MALTPLKTNRAKASEAIRAAYDARMLVAQGTMRQPVYFEEGSRRKCAIGALFSDDDARALENTVGLYNLVDQVIDNGDLIVPAEDRTWFIKVQKAHDVWGAEESAVNWHNYFDKQNQTITQVEKDSALAAVKAEFLELLTP